MPSVGLLVLCLTLISVGTQGNTNNIVSKFLETKQSCLDASQLTSEYCLDMINSNIDNEALELLCTDCREEFVNLVRVCDSEDAADQLDDACATLGYEKPVTEKPTSGSAPIAAIIGGVVGGFALILVAILIIAAITYFSFKQSKRKEMLATQAQAPTAPMDALPPPPMYHQELDPGAMYPAPPPAPYHVQQQELDPGAMYPAPPPAPYHMQQQLDPGAMYPAPPPAPYHVQQQLDPGAMYPAPPPAPYHVQQAYNPQASGYY